MYITWETDYAIQIVTYLAQVQKRSDAQSISEKTGISLRFSLKILRNLVEAKIVKSFKGIHGGYELNRPAKEISLLQIMRVTEGEYVFSRCLRGVQCNNEQGTKCKMRQKFAEISQTVRDMLSNITIDQLV